MRPFRIEVPQAAIDDLHARLARSRFSIPTPGTAGIPVARVRAIVEYWLSEFDWRAQERRLNGYPQFQSDDGVHFVHLRADDPDASAIVLTHGWPYSFAEMLPLADELRDFHVVVPSLPGFGFSAPFDDEPFTGPAVARRWHDLLAHELGYERFYTYGEDVGAGVSDWLAVAHAEAVLGIHAAHAAFPPAERRSDLAPVETAFFEWLDGVWKGGTGYSDIQSTRPDTLAAGLSDSPAGLAAWIVEKFDEWSDPRTEFTLDQLLTTVSLYWFTNTVGTSFRAYADSEKDPPLPVVTVPAGVTVQVHESEYPRELAERTYLDLRLFHRLERGGHFTAAEAPDLLAADIREFVAETRR
jgi:pimeloyl-ACP methyl ester carboxylesterase